jgi:hypothetical protein
MEDEEQSGLQISLGDFMCLFFLFVVHLAVPSYYFFLLFVGSPVHSSLIATFDDDDEPFGSKMKAATFRRHPPRTYG